MSSFSAEFQGLGTIQSRRVGVVSQGRFEVDDTGNQSPSQHLSVHPHAAVKPNHRLTHRHAHS